MENILGLVVLVGEFPVSKRVHLDLIESWIAKLLSNMSPLLLVVSTELLKVPVSKDLQVFLW